MRATTASLILAFCAAVAVQASASVPSSNDIAARRADVAGTVQFFEAAAIEDREA